MNSHPHLEVITGPMFSGKTTELVRRLRRAKIAGLRVALCRPQIDHTSLTHDSDDIDIDSFVVMDDIPFEFYPSQMLPTFYDVVGIDEVQFLPEMLNWIVSASDEMVVIVSGLDTTYRYEPWNIMGELMAYAERVDKLAAICVKCGQEGTRTQRLVNGEPAKASDPTVLVGDEDFYEARCSNCWEIG